MTSESDGAQRNEFLPAADDPLREAPPVDDIDARRARSAIEGRLFSGPAQPIHVGRYRIEGRIGAGGMGVVYRARDPELARDVAVKLMHPGTASGREGKTARARLVREARAMARLAHPNVIHVYDVGAVEDGVFIAMELVEGQSLAAWREAAPRSWREVLAVCLDAGRGLAAAHAAGIVHRDFKPENVLVGADGRARVGDFGLAGGAVPATGAYGITGDLELTDDASTSPTLDDLAGKAALESLAAAEASDSALDDDGIAGALTRTGMLLGTPKYMAPEQEVAGSASPLADQFSFCVALYEALYQRPPYAGDTVAQYRKHVHDNEPLGAPPETKVKAWVHALIIRGLSVDPQTRHESMTILIDRLDAALSDPSPVRRRRRRRRQILWASLAGLGVVASVASIAVLAPFDTDPGTDPSTGNAAVAVVHAVDRPPGHTDQTTPTPATDKLPQAPAPPHDPVPASESPGPAADSAAPDDTAQANTAAPTARRIRADKARKKANERPYCYFKPDTYDHITNRKRKRNQLRHRGECLVCSKGPPAAYNPSDCRGFRVCRKADDDTQCDS